MAAHKFAYYPGCSLHHGTGREFDVSTRLVCRALGIALEEIKDWTCCGASSAHLTSHFLATALPARNLKLAEAMGLPMAIACALCFSRHRFALHDLKDSSLREEVAQALSDSSDSVSEGGGRTGEVPVLHLLQILDGREVPVARSLKGLKVACYYGCLLARPIEVTGFDDEENPQIMDRLLASLGAQPVDWGLKTTCCGAGMGLPHQDMVERLCRRLLSAARAEGAQCLAVACPMCHYNLDTYQKEIEAKYREEFRLPIIYFTQLLGLALGFSPKELWLGRHLVDPRPLLGSLGLAEVK